MVASIVPFSTNDVIKLETCVFTSSINIPSVRLLKKVAKTILKSSIVVFSVRLTVKAFPAS